MNGINVKKKKKKIKRSHLNMEDRINMSDEKIWHRIKNKKVEKLSFEASTS